MAFQFGIPKKLIKRVSQIEIDTHYYDKDVIPSAQEIFTYTVDKENKTAVITGLVDPATITAVIPYKIQYDQTSGELSADVLELSENCFSDNDALKSITIPNTIHVIPSNCFKNCSVLHTVNIPSSVHTIKTNAFNNCDSLRSVHIPYNVSIIEDGAFLECENLKIICYKHSVAESYAIDNNIPHSLISYTLDEDITKNSENLVTSGVVWKHIKQTNDKIDTHIDNKSNPHDDSSFNNSKLLGDTTINSVNIDKGELTSIQNKDTSLINKKYVDDADNELSNTISDVNKNLNKKINETTSTINENITSVNTALTKHINNKENPHDDSKFSNITLNGTTTIEKATISNVNDDDDLSVVNVGYVKSAIENIEFESSSGNNTTPTNIDLSGYQKLSDNNLETDKKSIVGAINEVNEKVHTNSGSLVRGWNTVSLNKLYPISWRFLNKPLCYTDEGLSVDFRLKNLEPSSTNIINNSNTFDIYVPTDCKYMLSTTDSNDISGYPVDYLVIKYYYTGNDGEDLDTVTEIRNTNWPSTIRKNIGYGYQPDSPITNNNVELIKFSGDNRGGGSLNANDKFYESVYINISEIQSILPNEDIEITLYGSWYKSIGNGYINVDLECFANETTPEVRDVGDRFELYVNGESLQPTYSTHANIGCYVTSFSNSNKTYSQNYNSMYTPVFNLVFHKVSNDSNYRTISITALS